MDDYDALIVGAGPAGCVTALTLARSGVRCAMIEREQFPRFHVGESLTGGVGALLRSLGFEDEMTARDFPVKRGVTVYGTAGKNSFFVPVVDEKPDGTREKATTWQVRRSSFDDLLSSAAQDAGADVITGSARSPIVEDDRVTGVEVEVDGALRTIGSRMLVDASGQHCFASKHGLASEKLRGNYDRQLAIFTHVEGAERGPDGPHRDDTVILYQESRHWAWFIPIDADVTSVGVVVPAAYFRASGESPAEFLEREFRELNPELASRMAPATSVIEPQIIRNYSYEIEDFSGPGWMCVGDSHRFIDPVFSFGVHLGMHEGQRAADTITSVLGNGMAEADGLADYHEFSTKGQDIIQDLVDAFWNQPLSFGYVAHYKHPDDIIDLFAGRFYWMDEPSEGLKALRRINERAAASN